MICSRERTVIMRLSLFVLMIDYVNPAKVLLAIMDQGRSHASSFTPFMHRLQRDNHSVSIYSNLFEKEIDFGLEERFIYFKGDHNPFHDPQFAHLMWHGEFSFVSQIFPFYFGSQTCARVLKERREEFESIATDNWDMVLTDSLFSVCGYAIANLNKASHIMMHSSDVESAHGSTKAFQRNYGILPMNFMSSTNNRCDPAYFFDRLSSTCDWFGSLLATMFVSNLLMNRAVSDVLPSFSFYEHNRRSSFSFTDMPEALYPPAPRTNDYFSYGSYCREAKKLTGDMLALVEDPASKGTIVVAFGTIVNWAVTPEDKLNSFVNALNKLSDYRIIWGYNGKEIGTLSHIRRERWIPQNELLNHQKTVLFISHGGLKSVKEAACAGVPSLFMPMFAEQVRNSWLAKNKGFGDILDKFALSTEYLQDRIDRLLSNSSYKDKAIRLRSQLLDRPLSSLDQASLIFQRLSQNGGRMPDYFYPKGLHLSYLTTFNIDFLLVIPIAVLYLVCS